MKNYGSKFKNIIPFLIIGFVLLPTITFAAILYLEPSSGEYHPGDTFLVEIKIDTENECINTVEAELKYPQNILKAVDFSRGDSILTLWLQFPEIDQSSGLISFSGGIPGGYCGRIPGDPGASNLFGKIIFQVQELAEDSFSEIEFMDNSQVLLNDGKGTLAKLTTKGANYTILIERLEEVPKDEWQEELKQDKVLPEPFVIEVHQDQTIFDGKHFLIFSTTDKQTGLDYFEIKEGEEDWKRGNSPYLLEDQELRSVIKVKAIDKAGNERIVEISSSGGLVLKEKKILLWHILILIVLVLIAIFWIFKKLKKKKKPFSKTSLS